MRQNTELEFAAQTDTGLVRTHNEDSVAISPSYGFAILAGGMGGYSDGEVASGIATTVVKTALEEGLGYLLQQSELSLHQSRQIHQLVIDAIQHAKAAILDAARARAAIYRHGNDARCRPIPSR